MSEGVAATGHRQPTTQQTASATVSHNNLYNSAKLNSISLPTLATSPHTTASVSGNNQLGINAGPMSRMSTGNNTTNDRMPHHQSTPIQQHQSSAVFRSQSQNLLGSQSSFLSSSPSSAATDSPERKKLKLENCDSSAGSGGNDDLSALKKRILEHKYMRLRSVKEKYSEHVTELFFLQQGGNMMEYPTWRKKPQTPQLITFSRQHRLDQSQLDELAVSIVLATRLWL